ncbi:PilN domain-containing protein [Enterobacter sp. Bisph1]|uniref:PilN domain-containing protein n=1 Tax=Enterobacter sp. Bisph1 TaxID=1274399 RepID=UPI00057C22F1|nr:PilN domain-containing protein [Enterobacter sp. Bisph1]
MQPVVNFLPWRRRQRRRCLRFWATVFLVTAVTLTVGGTLWRASVAVELRIETLWQQSDASQLARLLAAEQPLQVRYQRWQQSQAKLFRRQRTEAWRQTLTALSENLPAKAWLTALRWQQNRLDVSGLASSFHALRELQQGLQTVKGFHLQPAGAMERDAQGRWQFHFQLNRESDDAQP